MKPEKETGEPGEEVSTVTRSTDFAIVFFKHRWVKIGKHFLSLLVTEPDEDKLNLNELVICLSLIYFVKFT